MGIFVAVLLYLIIGVAIQVWCTGGVEKASDEDLLLVKHGYLDYGDDDVNNLIKECGGQVQRMRDDKLLMTVGIIGNVLLWPVIIMGIMWIHKRTRGKNELES